MRRGRVAPSVAATTLPEALRARDRRPGAPSPTPGRSARGCERSSTAARWAAAAAGGERGESSNLLLWSVASHVSATGRRRRVGIGLGARGSGSDRRRPAPAPRRAGRGRCRDRRRGPGGADAATPVRPPPGCPARSTVRAPRQAACATAVRATTRSARIPSTSNAAHSAAIRRNSLSGNTTSSTSARAAAIRRASSASALGVAFGERVRVGLVGHPLPDDLHPHVDVARRVHVDGEPEPVQQLRTQFALLGIHRADQHEPGLVRMRDAVAFDVHPSHRGGVEQHVDQMIVQQVDLVDVEHAAVRAGQQSRRKRVLAIAQHPLQVQRPDHPVLGGARAASRPVRHRTGVDSRSRPTAARPARARPSTWRCPSRRGSAHRRSPGARRTTAARAAADRARRSR